MPNSGRTAHEGQGEARRGVGFDTPYVGRPAFPNAKIETGSLVRIGEKQEHEFKEEKTKKKRTVERALPSARLELCCPCAARFLRPAGPAPRRSDLRRGGRICASCGSFDGAPPIGLLEAEPKRSRRGRCMRR